MSKRVIISIVVFTILYLAGSWLHDLYVSAHQIALPFPIQKSYQFHFIFCVVLIVHFELLSKFKNIKSQLGFLYLVSVVLKLGLLSYVFKSVLIDQETIALQTKFALLIPALIFLIGEVIFISKIILKNSKEY